MSDFMTRARELSRLVWRKARQGSEVAAEALEQQAAVQRLAAQTRKLARERTALIAQIGAKVYALHGQGKIRNQDVLGDCLRLDEIARETAGLQRQIEEIRTASSQAGTGVVLTDDAALTDDVETAAACPTPEPGTANVVTAAEAGDDDYARTEEPVQVDPAEGAADAAEASDTITVSVDDEYLPPDQKPAPDGCSGSDDEA